jgi:tetratricopeptide (TPR) repeat protein/predicted Ser/Thr protein kinase
MADQEERIGPYRVLERLGAGGMGEVFLAWDERLDRRVALKRIRSGLDASPERRERFRREARIAARLNHPAIVQIYDVLAEGESDTIVMEYVEGTNLRAFGGGRPLPLEAALVIAHDIAEGLAEAHRQGVVHRDLKRENVLVTRAGRAKITDFGIAKRLLAGRAEDSLTAQGHVLGTYRAMSPEQARGEEVDHRSDLFSFGVLIYETLAGRSPFEAENELATLNRIVQGRQTPLSQVNPAVPEPVSRLVDHLLEKDPRMRPRSAGEVARELAPAVTAAGTGPQTVLDPAEPMRLPTSVAVSGSGVPAGRRSRLRAAAWIAGIALAAGLVAAGAWLAWRPPAEPLYVAVLKPEVRAASGVPADLGLLASSLRISSVRGLLALQGVSPKSLEETDAVPGLPSAVARALSADEVVSTRLDCRPTDCHVSVSRIRGRDGAVLWAGDFEIPPQALGVAAGAVETRIRQAYSERSPRRGAFVSEAGDEDLREFLTLYRRFESRQEVSGGDLLQRLEALRARAPRFLEVYLLENEVARFQHYFSRRPEVLRQAFTVAEEARKMAPEEPNVLVALFYTALEAGDLHRAEEALGDLERLAPGDVAVPELRSGLLLARGQTREAIALMRDEVGRRASYKRLVSLGVIEFQQGEIADGRSHLEESLRLAPGNFDALSALGQLELQSGDPGRAREIYQVLVRRSPRVAEVSNLGLANLLTGHYPEAAEAFREVVRQEPRNPLLVLNLADACLLLGRKEEAESLYREAVRLIDQDSHAVGPQFLTAKAQALAHLGRGVEAVTAIRDALRLAPESGAPAFEAATVYALLGEETSAISNAEAALANGCGTSWFTLPWFDGLRRNPRFAEALARYAAKAPSTSTGSGRPSSS